MSDPVNAVAWLREKLTEPRLISSLIAQWIGPLDNSTGRTIAELMTARWTLGVKASIGTDGYFLWTLPAARKATRH